MVDARTGGRMLDAHTGGRIADARTGVPTAEAPLRGRIAAARLSWRTAAAGLLLAGLAAVPWVSAWLGQGFYLTFFARVMILGLAAVGLNLALGVSGMVSLGHALYIGIGVYAVGLLSANGIDSGGWQLGTGIVACTVVAALIGLVCLRTTGMAFIMITLAFAQMAYYGAVSLRSYGGDDGLPIAHRSDFGLFSLADDRVLYWTIYAVLLAVLFAVHRLVHSRFGMVLRGTRSNRTRMEAMGHPTLRYRLSAYVLSALICMLAGFFLANLTSYLSPSYLQWQASGDLVVMVVLGGMGTVIGPLFGAVALVVLEELLQTMKPGLPFGIDTLLNEHPMVVVGAFVVVVALGLKSGLYGALLARERAQPRTRQAADADPPPGPGAATEASVGTGTGTGTGTPARAAP